MTVDPEGDTRYAIRQVRAVALTRTDLEDEAFLKNILVANTRKQSRLSVMAVIQRSSARLALTDLVALTFLAGGCWRSSAVADVPPPRSSPERG